MTTPTPQDMERAPFPQDIRDAAYRAVMEPPFGDITVLLGKVAQAIADERERCVKPVERLLSEWREDDAAWRARKGIGELPHESARIEDIKDVLAAIRSGGDHA